MPADQNAAQPSGRGRVRWIICGLLFFATTANYVDRQVIGILKPVLQRELHWSEADFAWVVFSFQGAYALMMPIAGRLIDSLGTRLGYALAVTVWSLASMSHSLAQTLGQFAAARFGLGIGEAANFPAAVKTVAEWFPKKDRAFATGIFNSGSNIGAIIAPLLVPFVAVRMGWRATFLFTGAVDLMWIAAWFLFYRKPAEHPMVSSWELAHIQSDGPEEEHAKPVYALLLRQRAAWAFILGKFITDPVWWFYSFWLPGFLNRTYGLNLSELGPPLLCIYLAADVGSIAGGWLPASLAARGWNLSRARRTAMLVCAIAATPVISLLIAKSLWGAVALLGLAIGAHQGWSANLFTIVSDNFPRSSVGSVVGLGGLAGAVGGMLISPAVGYWLDFSDGSYEPLFLGAGSAYLLALSLIHLLLGTRTHRPS